MTGRPNWTRLRGQWPNAEASRFVDAGGLTWHVQVMGSGPDLLLLHGAGAATHSWRSFAPLLARRWRVIAPDLPGHGFTDPALASGRSLPGMARGVAALIAGLGAEPELIVGHSAGGAIAARMALDGLAAPAALIGLNAALAPFPGIAGHMAPSLARMIFYNPVAIHMAAWRAGDPATVRRLIRSTGSEIDERGAGLYQLLFTTSGHVAGALGMMANWDLSGLWADLPRLVTPFGLIVGAGDAAVPPDVSVRAAGRVRHGAVRTLPGLGHLAHEERPLDVYAALEEVLDELGAGAAAGAKEGAA